MSDIQFTCPRCGHNLIVDAAGAGLSVPCPDCRESIAIPVNVERQIDQMADFNTGVDARPADKIRTGGSPLENTGTGRQEPLHRVVMRGVVRVLRVLLRWLAKVICLIGWLVIVAFRKVLMVPVLRMYLGHQCRKAGEYAYQHKVAESAGAQLRMQITAVDAGVDTRRIIQASSGKDWLSQMTSRLDFLMARAGCWIKKKMLFRALGNELIFGESVDAAMSRHADCAKRTRYVTGRLLAVYPSNCGIGNLVAGVAVLCVIGCAIYPTRKVVDSRGMGAVNEPVYLEKPVGDMNENMDSSTFMATGANNESKLEHLDPAITGADTGGKTSVSIERTQYYWRRVNEILLPHFVKCMNDPNYDLSLDEWDALANQLRRLDVVGVDPVLVNKTRETADSYSGMRELSIKKQHGTITREDTLKAGVGIFAQAELIGSCGRLSDEYGVQFIDYSAQLMERMSSGR